MSRYKKKKLMNTVLPITVSKALHTFIHSDSLCEIFLSNTQLRRRRSCTLHKSPE